MSTVAVSQDVAEITPLKRLELTRVIAAPRAKVFDAWTRPDVMRQWLHPAKMQTPVAEADPVVGGNYFIKMQGTMLEELAERPSQSVNHVATATGQYTKVNPYDLLQFTWTANWSPDEISLVTLHFRDMDGGTEVRLIHEQIGSDSSCSGYTQGWTGCLENLELFFSK